MHIRTHSELLTNGVLRLVELRNATLGNWSISRRDLISSSPVLYGQTVLRAAAIHRDIRNAAGLVWTSNQCDPDDACLFFGDRVRESDFTAVRSRDGASDKSFAKEVRDEGWRRGIVLTIRVEVVPNSPVPRFRDSRMIEMIAARPRVSPLHEDDMKCYR